MTIAKVATRCEAEMLMDDLIEYANKTMYTYYVVTVGDLINKADWLSMTEHNKDYALYKQGWTYGCVFEHDIEIVKNDKLYDIVVSNYKEL